MCPTCSHTMQNFGTMVGKSHFWCPRCGTLRETVGGWTHDEAPKLVDRVRGFIGMISPSAEGRFLRKQCEISGTLEAVTPPGSR